MSQQNDISNQRRAERKRTSTTAIVTDTISGAGVALATVVTLTLAIDMSGDAMSGRRRDRR